jgi:acyl-coenzyme A thioesterase PaaI-like protein
VVFERARSAAEHRARDVLRRMRVPLPDDLGSELLALDRGRVAIRFVFAADDPGHAMLLEQGGSVVSQLERTGRLAIEMIDGPDHTFTPRWSHARFVDAIVRAVS